MNFRVHKNGKFFWISKQTWYYHELLCDMKLLFYVLRTVLHMTPNLPKTEILSDVGAVTSLAMAPPTRRIKTQAFILVTKRCLSRLHRSDLWWCINTLLWLIYTKQPVSLIMPNGQAINIDLQTRNWWWCGHFRSLNKPHDIILGIILFLTVREKHK